MFLPPSQKCDVIFYPNFTTDRCYFSRCVLTLYFSKFRLPQYSSIFQVIINLIIIAEISHKKCQTITTTKYQDLQIVFRCITCSTNRTENRKQQEKGKKEKRRKREKKRKKREKEGEREKERGERKRRERRDP